jgi:hypothetical protein
MPFEVRYSPEAVDHLSSLSKAEQTLTVDMKSIDLSDVAALAPHVQPGAQVPLFVTKNGHTVAAVVPTDDDDIEDMLLCINPEFQAIFERPQQRVDAEGGVSSSGVRNRLGLPPG